MPFLIITLVVGMVIYVIGGFVIFLFFLVREFILVALDLMKIRPKPDPPTIQVWQPTPPPHCPPPPPKPNP